MLVPGGDSSGEGAISDDRLLQVGSELLLCIRNKKQPFLKGEGKEILRDLLPRRNSPCDQKLAGLDGWSFEDRKTVRGGDR